MQNIYKLSANSPLPPQKQILSVTDNKKQLIQIIVETLLSERSVHECCQNRLIVTGQDNTPVKITPGGIVIRRQDLSTSHKEADVVIVAQAIYAAKEEQKNVAVVADDTDVYVLLYYYQSECLKVLMKLQSTQSGRDSLTLLILRKICEA